MDEVVSRVLKVAEGGVMSDIPAMHDPVARFFMQAVFIIAICRGLTVFTYFLKQPVVVFEIIGGILLGPSAFGRNEYYLLKMFPKKSLANLSLVANIGLVLYLFLVGMELDPKMLKMHFRKSGMISLFGMVVPFCLGIAVAKVVFNTLQADDPHYKDVSFTAFFVFMGTAMSITAFPVLARMLKEGGLIYTRPGALAMGAAAVDDASAWCLLILAISLANAKDLNIGGKVFATVIGYGLGLFLIIRPALAYLVEWVEKREDPLLNGHLFALMICLCFLSAWVTYLIGVHFIFGAFLFGLCVPRNTELFHTCETRIEQLVLTFTLPIYFALSGLKTDISQIHGNKQGSMIVLVCVIACAGKMIGTGGAALLNGMSIRESAVIATLMNTRGLVELIVLNVGLDCGILSTKTFSVMVIMALFTTFLTTPILEIIYPKHLRVHYSEADKTTAVEEINRSTTPDSLDRAATDITKQWNHVRLALVVDRLDQMSSLVKLISAFAPSDDKSTLAVTAVHLVEPSNTARDEFLAVNDEGQVVSVKEQITDIHSVLEMLSDPSIIKKPETLPLVVFCNAVETNLNAFEVRGDPLVFPKELKELSRHNDCSLVALPWRPQSEYIEKLIWDSVTILDIPTAVFAQKEVKSVSANDEPATATDNGVKQRSGSIYQSLPAFDVKSTGKIALRSKAVNSIVVMVTAHSIVAVLLNIVSRLLVDKNNQLVVFIAADAEAHSEEARTVISSFVKENDKADNLRTITCSSVSSDVSGLFNECKKSVSASAMFLCPFLKPAASRDAAGRKNRSGSFSTSLASAIIPTPSTYSSYSHTRFAGCEDVAHLELGVLGSLAYDDASTTSATQIIVIHEGGQSNGAKLRRSSLETTDVVEGGAGAVKEGIEMV